MTGSVSRARHRRGVPVRARWLARAAIVAALGAIVLLVLGDLRSLIVVVLAVAALVIMFAGGWWFLSRRGLLRWAAAILAVAAPVAVLTIYAVRGVLWVVVVVLVLFAAALALGRLATTAAHPPERTAEHQATPASRPYLVMNPRSGGGKVRRFDLDAKARSQGATVCLLEGSEHIDVAEVARQAVGAGADLLGVAGGDGTQALVAGVAAEHAVPFLVISAGTRNHFAMDLGLDREHPDACLAALDDPVELRIDLGDINGRIFVNNASFGAYAAVVQSPAYRDDKRGTTLRMLPDLLTGQSGPRLRVYVDGTLLLENPTAVLVSNNSYELDDLAGLGRRARLDAGVLGVVAVSVASTAEAVGLLRGRRSDGVRRLTAHEVTIDADAAEVPVGIDGEALMLSTPVRCTVRPQALRVYVPRTRPGSPASAARPAPAQVLLEAVGRG
jgi:diacylglycerol kinase family enzyme